MPDLNRLVKPLLAKPCWRVRWDAQLNLDLSFGAPLLSIREPHVSRHRSPRVRAQAARRVVTVRAEFWLWIYVAYWRITLVDGRSARLSSSTRAKDIVCAHLEGERIQTVEVSPVTGHTCFTFDLGSRLEVRRYAAREDADMWTLYMPRGMALSVRGDGCYRSARANTRQQKWYRVPGQRAT
jgi:hypothetical protein